MIRGEGVSDIGWNAHQNALHGFSLSLDERAETYIAGDGKEVYRAFCFFTWEAIMAGCKKLGAKAVCERIRWQGMLQKNNREFLVNNSYVSYMARKFMKENPQCEGIFETREKKNG